MSQFPPKSRLLAVCSSGGHWSQLLLLGEAFDGHLVTWACTAAGAGKKHGIDQVALLPECNRNRPLAMPKLVREAWRLLRGVRPDVIVSTGALPGLVCIALGRVMGARTVWVESMANSEELSLSGRWASRIAHECLVQWPQLERSPRTRYAGAVL